MIKTYKKIVQNLLGGRAVDWTDYKARKMEKTKEFMWQHRNSHNQNMPLDFRSRATGAYYTRH